MTNKTYPALILAALLATPLAAQEAATAKYKVNFYGHIKTDVSLDNHGVTGNDYAQYVASDKASERDFRASAKGTRFGLDVSADKVAAKLETDFLEDAGNTNAGLRLRHAYMTLKGEKFDLLAGQTWHLLPLEFSGTNNEFALGYSGALWMRAPQLRLTYRKSDAVTFAAAAVRPTRKLEDAEGTASGLPQLQGQAQFKTALGKFTLMGAYGKWKSSGTVNLVDLGYNIPLTAALTLNGQLWTGQNLYDFLGGIGNTGYGSRGVRASGGFANLNLKPAGLFSYNLAYGTDNPVDVRLAAGSRAKNTTVMANVNWLAYEKVSMTFEVAKMTTEYKGADDRENIHTQFSMKFPF